MKKILLLSLFLLSVLFNEVLAQSRTITGRVTDAASNDGLPHPELELPLIMSALLLSSSIPVHLAESGIKKGKTGILKGLGWPHRTKEDIGLGWKRILSTVRSYADVEPTLSGRIEELIDFVTVDPS